MAVICFRGVDGAHWEPDHKDDQDDHVGDRADFVDPTDEPGGLHSDEALNNQEGEESQVYVPRLRHVARDTQFDHW